MSQGGGSGGCDYCSEFAADFPSIVATPEDPRLVQCPRCFALYEVASGSAEAVPLSREDAQARHPNVGRLHPHDPGVAIPDLHGLQASEVIEIANRLALTVYDATTVAPLKPDPAVVVQQWPDPGHRLWPGDGFTVRTNRRPVGEWYDESGDREPAKPGPSRGSTSEAIDGR